MRYIILKLKNMFLYNHTNTLPYVCVIIQEDV